MVRETNSDITVFLEVSNIWSEELQRLNDLLPNSIASQPSGVGVVVSTKLPINNYSIKFLQPKDLLLLQVLLSTNR